MAYKKLQQIKNGIYFGFICLFFINCWFIYLVLFLLFGFMYRVIAIIDNIVFV